jgi:hypothetical protein
MHQEHTQWQAESNHWRDDLGIWEKEIDDVIGQLSGPAPEISVSTPRLANSSI